ncbi:MAG: hypothetical protein EOP47_30125 [Sphingobacteriaceae bacterium]|nr:MAG: hypothetical protein EOP47_30125 [Sphingobacteriaceae bacterium]
MARILKGSLLSQLSGRLGDDFVVKQYKDKVVLSKMPDMSNIKSTALQSLKRGWFAEAIKYAQGILRDPKKKLAYAKKLPKGKSVYHAAITEFMNEKGKLVSGGGRRKA